MAQRLILRHGDCVEVLAEYGDGSLGAVISDPPYGLEFMGKEWDRLDGVGTGNATFTKDGMGKGFHALPSYSGSPNPLCRKCKGSKRGRDQKGFKLCRCAEPEFPNIGREQGRRMQMWHARWLHEVHRVLRPGGVAKVFCGTRTFHRLAAAMVEAGFTDIRLEAWGYGSGFPKSLNIGKALDKAAGAEREVIGFRVSAFGDADTSETADGRNLWCKPATKEVPLTGAPATEAAQLWEGWGTALKPSWEPVLVGRKDG